MSAVRIIMTGHGRGTVTVDGVQVKGVCAFNVEVQAGGDNHGNRLTLSMVPTTIEIEGEFDVTTIESEAREVVLGTPP